jgi:hypothetical protein
VGSITAENNSYIIPITEQIKTVTFISFSLLAKMYNSCVVLVMSPLKTNTVNLLPSLNLPKNVDCYHYYMF